MAGNGQVGPGIWLGLLQSCLEFCWLRASIVELVAFLLGLPIPVGNYSVLIFCSVPLDLDNAAFPFLAYSGIPVVSFGFYDVSNVCLPGVLIPCRVL